MKRDCALCDAVFEGAWYDHECAECLALIEDAARAIIRGEVERIAQNPPRDYFGQIKFTNWGIAWRTRPTKPQALDLARREIYRAAGRQRW